MNLPGWTPSTPWGDEEPAGATCPDCGGVGSECPLVQRHEAELLRVCEAAQDDMNERQEAWLVLRGTLHELRAAQCALDLAQATRESAIQHGAHGGGALTDVVRSAARRLRAAERSADSALGFEGGFPDPRPGEPGDPDCDRTSTVAQTGGD